MKSKEHSGRVLVKKNRISRKIFSSFLFILSLLLLYHCGKRADYISSVEIKLRSQSTWVLREDLTVKINSAGKVKQNKSDVKKVVAHVEILSYSERPSIFDLEGNPRAFSIRVKVRYKIRCFDEEKTGERNVHHEVKAQEGEFSLSETFLLSSFVSHLSGVKKARLNLKEKIKNRIILLSFQVC